MTPPIWERLPNEGPEAFQAFEAYRKLDPTERGLDRAYSLVKGRGRSAVRASGRWNTWFRLYDWKRRAEAWDAHLHVLALRQEEEAYLAKFDDFRDRQEKLAQAMTGAAANALTLAVRRLNEMVTKNESIPDKMLSSILRAAAAVGDAGGNAEARALGVEELIRTLKGDNTTP